MSKHKLFKRGDRLQVHIDRLSVGGRGVARFEGLVIFVPDTAPDEDVEVELSFVKKNFAEARLLRIVNASRARRTPPCPVAGICGGCNWQHVTYEEQLRQKHGLVTESLRRFAGLQEPIVEEVVPSPNEFRYRNRIQLHHAGRVLGYHKRGSHEIVDINDCPIAEETLAREIPALHEEFAGKKPGRFEILITKDGKIGRRFAQTTNEDDDVPASDKAGPAFSQVNSAQNENLVKEVMRLFRAQGEKPLTIYDLYSGSGNFTFPLAREFPSAKLRAVELNAESVRLGESEAKALFPNRDIEFHEADIASFFRRTKVEDDSLVLLDPPRSGCGDEVMQALAQSRVQTIVYVSCHPVTLARDLKVLLNSGFRLERMQPFDMFPQTDHIENVALLKRH